MVTMGKQASYTTAECECPISNTITQQGLADEKITTHTYTVFTGHFFT